ARHHRVGVTQARLRIGPRRYSPRTFGVGARDSEPARHSSGVLAPGIAEARLESLLFPTNGPAHEGGKPESAAGNDRVSEEPAPSQPHRLFAQVDGVPAQAIGTGG